MNSYGTLFRIQLFGESHGVAIGVVIDGVPPGLPLSTEDFQNDLSRRKGGSFGTTSRVEEERIQFLSGVFDGKTTGTPLAMVVENHNTLSSDYEQIRHIPRPGHADFTSKVKYGGCNDWRGAGHHSGRVTLALVLAGVVAKRVIAPIVINSAIVAIGGENPWDDKLRSVIEEGDSIGGIIECRIKNVPAGIGEPFFDSVESTIAHLIFAIPGIRGIEFGDGFKAAGMKGSEHNDPIISPHGATSRNGAGGINGGISNGNQILFRVAVKPTSSIPKVQESYNFATGKIEKFSIGGRHDACFALRTPVVIEAASAIALSDLWLQASSSGANNLSK